MTRLIPAFALSSFLVVLPASGPAAAGESTPVAPSPQGGAAQGKERERPAAKKGPESSRSVAAGKEMAARKAGTEAPLRFTNEDLEKYHRPPAAEDVAEEGAGEGEIAGAGGPPAPAARPAGAVRNAPPARSPSRPPSPPPQDPLKPFKDRDARERFRTEQIQGLRDTIAGMESRLQYLKTKREALLNPAAPLQVGRTRGPDDPPDPVPGPGKVPIQKEPTPPGKAPPKVFPGAGRIAIAPLFPALPEPQTDEDRENDTRMKVRDLLAQVEKEIEGLEAELEETRNILVDIETRFGAEAGIR
ncbi:MAG: hypothetical protein HY510_06435 [Acidobacteria bacterium]|nr:hypothetical protein [Acidobacteriota bacterium]